MWESFSSSYHTLYDASPLVSHTHTHDQSNYMVSMTQRKKKQTKKLTDHHCSAMHRGAVLYMLLTQISNITS